MSTRAVHWHDGMFLRPHHFLAAQRYEAHRAHQSEKWDHHHDWGLRSVDLDLDALANYRLVIRSLEARLREEDRRPRPDEAALLRLKREKLRLKDELERLRAS